MEGTSTVLSILKEKCDHSPEIRTFKALFSVLSRTEKGHGIFFFKGHIEKIG
jgi:hypothetical protein